MADKKLNFKFLKLDELRSKKPAELNKYLGEIKSTQAELQMQLSTNKLKTTHLISKLKHEVARVKTIQAQIKQKEEA